MVFIQLTGLSGAGKTTLAGMAKQLLEGEQIPVAVIDGDVYRRSLCADLGFSREDRCENIRRLGKVGADFCREGAVVIIAAINPYQEARDELKALYEAKTVYIDCPLPVLIERDTKGLYRRALLEKENPDYIGNLTGVNDPYDIPVAPDLYVNTAELPIEEAAHTLVAFIRMHL